jgi:hypothetical protein
MLELGKYSLGVGDRFAHQAKAQLQACMMASERGRMVVPVWNKSQREHVTIGSQPPSVQAAVAAAVHEMGYKGPFHVDADHIRLETVDAFIKTSDFFTIDVADSIGQPADAERVRAFVARHPELIGTVRIPGIEEPFVTTREDIAEIAGKFLLAVREAREIYCYILAAKGEGRFITEVSMDETDSPQTPIALLVILAAIADEGIPLQTIAPKFTGRFNKGVDYVGDTAQFEKEFRQDLAVLAYAAKQYGLPPNLKLSVHSGSDKFSLYPIIYRAIMEFGAGLHLKTAGTTWLEEIIGLAEGSEAGLALAKEIYSKAYEKRQALCAPYAAVIDIDPAKLPLPSEVNGWSSEQLAGAVRHEQANPMYNRHMRQLLHVGYKIAAQMGDHYLDMVEACELSISRNVTYNLYERHIKPLYLGEAAR